MSTSDIGYHASIDHDGKITWNVPPNPTKPRYIIRKSREKGWLSRVYNFWFWYCRDCQVTNMTTGWSYTCSEVRMHEWIAHPKRNNNRVSDTVTFHFTKPKEQ